MSKRTYEAAELYIELAYIRPKIWRRVRVPVNASLSQLHDILQCVFEWEESHLHAFFVGDQEYRDPDQMFNDFDEDQPGDETREKLSDVFAGGVTEFKYNYDFGDDWLHIIRLDQIITVTAPKELLVLLGGECAAPPEDCGGAPGYEYLLDVLSDPEHEEYDDLAEWVADGFDPFAFDKQGIATRLGRLGRAYSRSWNK